MRGFHTAKLRSAIVFALAIANTARVTAKIGCLTRARSLFRSGLPLYGQPAFIFDASFFQRLELSLETGEFCRRLSISANKECRRPEDDDHCRCDQRVGIGLIVLHASRLIGALLDTLHLRADLLTIISLVLNWRNIGWPNLSTRFSAAGTKQGRADQRRRFPHHDHPLSPAAPDLLRSGR